MSYARNSKKNIEFSFFLEYDKVAELLIQNGANVNVVGQDGIDSTFLPFDLNYLFNIRYPYHLINPFQVIQL